MKFKDIPPEEELLPYIEPGSNIILGIENRKKIHQTGLHHWHVNVWIPGEGDGIVYKQTKMKHGRADASVGWHISCTQWDIINLVGTNITALGPSTAVREWKEETGLDFLENDIISLGVHDETWEAPHPISKSWNNGIVLAYVLDRRVALDEILGSPTREDGLVFEEVSIIELLGLQLGDPRYLWKITSRPYRDILINLQKRLKDI